MFGTGGPPARGDGQTRAGSRAAGSACAGGAGAIADCWVSFMDLFLRRGVCRGVSFRIQRSRRKLAATSECSPEPVVWRATPSIWSLLSRAAAPGVPSLDGMGTTVRQAARATVQGGRAAVLAFGSIIFITVLLLTAVATLVVVGAGLLPETVLLVRRFAGAKRRQVAEWTGREIPPRGVPARRGSAPPAAAHGGP